MEPFLLALETTAIAEYLRFSRWSYALVNAAHILGIALLVGASMPLNLRLLGLWPGIPIALLARILAPMAGIGLALTILAGLLLFSIRAREYADIGFLQAKLVFALIGVGLAVTLHRAHGFQLEAAGHLHRRLHALASIICWVGALFCGRAIAFVTD